MRVLKDRLSDKDKMHESVKASYQREYEEFAQKERVAKIIYDTYQTEMRRFKEKQRELALQQVEQEEEARLKAEEETKSVPDKDVKKASKKAKRSVKTADMLGMNSPKKFRQESTKPPVQKLDSTEPKVMLRKLAASTRPRVETSIKREKTAALAFDSRRKS